MGMPSTAIYATELMRFYGVTTLVRVGSCGALQDRVALRDVVVATAAHTDSAMNRRRLRRSTPAADFDLVEAAVRLARGRDLPARGHDPVVGLVLRQRPRGDRGPRRPRRARGRDGGRCCTASPWPTAAGACASPR